MVKESNILSEVVDRPARLGNVRSGGTNSARRSGASGMAADGRGTRDKATEGLVDGVAVKGTGVAGLQPRARRSGWGHAPSAFQACGC